MELPDDVKRLLDRTEPSKYPEAEFNEWVKENRKTGYPPHVQAMIEGKTTGPVHSSGQ